MSHTTAAHWRRWAQITIGIIAFSLVWMSLTPTTADRTARRPQRTAEPWHPSQNATLGFGEILITVMPNRTDQLDAIALAAYYADIKITVLPGVTSVYAKTVPPGEARTAKVSPSELNCWRAHMNMARYMVEHRLESALLLEADVDWDVRIKDQLQRISEALPTATRAHPYGQDWMTFWLGVCQNGEDVANLGPAIKVDDDTVGSLDSYRDDEGDQSFSWIETTLNYYSASSGQRVVHRANSPNCLVAYGLTLEGARRALFKLGLDHLDGPIDDEFRAGLHNKEIPGIMATPPLFSQWRSGEGERDSDFDRGGFVYQHPGHPSSGPHIVQSMRRSLRDLTFAKGPGIDWSDKEASGTDDDEYQDADN